MPNLRYPIVVLRESLQGDLDFCRALPLDQIARIVPPENGSVLAQLREGIEQAIHELPLEELHKHMLPPEIQLGQTELVLEPPDDSTAWQSELTLNIPFCFWAPAEGTLSAYIPMIGSSLHAKNPKDLERLILLEVKGHLSRERATKDLRELHAFTLFSDPRLEREDTTLKIQSPREKSEGVQTEKKGTDTLNKIGIRLYARNLPPAWMMDEQVAALAELLSHSQPQSVLLVGPSGVGKSAAYRELVRTAKNFGMGEFEFWETNGSRLIAGMSGFGEWQERCDKLIHEIQSQPIVVHLGNLIELIEVGRGGGMTIGIADFLIPHIARRKLLVVVECTPEQISIAEKQSPRILDVLQQLNFVPPAPEVCQELLEKVAKHHGRAANVTVEASAVASTELLHRRFALYSPAPGRAILFLTSLVDSASSGTRIDRGTVIDHFAAQTGLPRFLLSEEVSLDLQAVHQTFSQRLIGQAEPVDRIVDTIAAMKANMNRPGRPIGSYLFIGPTGVGKTEMAKAIAEFMYGDATRLIRIDMSEYSHSLAASRLIGGFGEGDGILTSKVREQPFTVLLLDEFEKADPAVFDLLLQVLGEGRLTDGRGKPADFTTSIIIMTSNLGVESFREGGLGFSSQAQSQSWREHFTVQLQKFVRPEFFNRIDQIVPFQPLDRVAMQQITRRELNEFRKRHGIAARRLRLDIGDDAIDWLVANGCEPRYGARPLKRLITKQLIQPLAGQLNRYRDEVPVDGMVTSGLMADGSPGSRITQGPDRSQRSDMSDMSHGSDGSDSSQRSDMSHRSDRSDKTDPSDRSKSNSLQVSVRPAEQINESKPVARDQILKNFNELARQRRRSQALNHSPIVERIRNRIFRIEQTLKEHKSQQRQVNKDGFEALDRIIRAHGVQLEGLQHTESQTRSLENQLMVFEEQGLQSIYKHQQMNWAEFTKQTKAFEQEITKQILDLFLTENPGSERVVILMYSRNHQNLKFLYDAYSTVALKHDLRVHEDTLHRYSPEKEGIAFSLRAPHEGDGELEKIPMLVDVRHRQPKIALFGGQDQIGIALTVKGRLGFHWLSLERGVHRFNANDHDSVLVETTGEKLFDHNVPERVDRLPSELFTANPFRRHYNTKEKTVHDVLLDHKRREIENWPTAIGELLEETFEQHLNRFVNTWI